MVLTPLTFIGYQRVEYAAKTFPNLRVIKENTPTKKKLTIVHQRRIRFISFYHFIPISSYIVPADLVITIILWRKQRQL